MKKLSRNQIAGCISIVGTCLFLAVIFFLPCFTSEAIAQTTSRSGDDELTPVAHPSRLYGTTLPQSVDLRSEMPPVGDQGDVWSQSCVTFASVYYQMTQYVKHFKHPSWDLTNPEHQFSVAFIFHQGGGGYPPNSYELLMELGCVDTAEMQYNQNILNQPTNAQIEAAKPYKISGYAALWDHNGGGAQAIESPPYARPNPINNAKAWLADGHVLSVCIDPNAPQFPGGGRCDGPPTVFYDIIDPNYHYSPGHAVAICGYNDNINPSGKDADHRGGFLMVNSEGPRWNGDMHGYIWLSYAYVKQYVEYCFIMTMDGESDAPVITGCTTQDGGSLVTISGTNFGSYRRLAGVTFNDVPAANIISITNDSVTVRVPHCATSGPLVVYNWEGTPSNSFSFEVVAKTSTWIDVVNPLQLHR